MQTALRNFQVKNTLKDPTSQIATPTLPESADLRKYLLGVEGKLPANDTHGYHHGSLRYEPERWY